MTANLPKNVATAAPMAQPCCCCDKPATRNVKAPTAAKVPGFSGLTYWRPVCDGCAPQGVVS
jgi:hypothetical protein